MVAHEYIYNFSNFKYFLYFWWTGFVIRFFPGFVQVLIRFRFSGSVGLTTGSVFVTLVLSRISFPLSGYSGERGVNNSFTSEMKRKLNYKRKIKLN